MVVRLSPRQAAQFILPDPPKKVAPKRAEPTEEGQTFDASRIFDYEDIANSTMLWMHKQIKDRDYLSLNTLLNTTNRELHDHVANCNRIAWGSHTWSITCGPTKAEQAKLQTMFDGVGGLAINWQNKARKAHEARVFANLIAEALEVAREKALGDQDEAYDRTTEAELREQFEAEERDAKEARFQEWRASQ